MQILYGDECRTVFKNSAGGGACSIVYLPFHRNEAEKKSDAHLTGDKVS